MPEPPSDVDRTLSALLQRPVCADISVAGLQLDSRLVSVGDLFLALAGERRDGRDYIAAAREVGASAIVAEAGLNEWQKAAAAPLPLIEIPQLGSHLGELASRFYGAPSQAMFVAGITGTNGKTTTSRLAAQLLRSDGAPCGVIGTLGAVLDERVDEARNTTPDALAIQAQLAQWRDRGVRQSVMEVTSHSLVQERVKGVAFDVAVLTNLSHDHLDYHGTMQRYAAAKARLFAYESLAHAVINADDPFADTIRRQLAGGVELTEYSVAGACPGLHVSGVACHRDGIRARLHSPWGSGQLHCSSPALFNLANLLAAIAVACIRGMDFQRVLELAPGLRGVPGRMEYVANSRDLQLVVDYSHTPAALLQALAALRLHTRGRLVCVFGCGGDRDAKKRPLMGRITTEQADRVIVTSDNPRGESPQAIVDEVLAGCEFEVEVELDRARAITRAVATAQPGDCILVAGKGHETYQQLGRERVPFSDVEQLRLAASDCAPQAPA